MRGFTVWERVYYYRNSFELPHGIDVWHCLWQWFSELGLTPPGNADPVQRALWEQPGDAGSISERGRVAAATSMAKVNVQTMVDRGLKEEVSCISDPLLMRHDIH